MTTPRSEILIPNEPTYYHCVSRCVRRAFLCGWCKLLNKTFDHRKDWVRQRLSLLVEIFAIELVAYAAMSNHLHTLIQTRPDLALLWTPDEVAIRWLHLFPAPDVTGKSTLSSEHPAVKRITDHPEIVAVYRERLSSISWFNRCLNEYIARKANKEDDCKGRFWEGRFKCSRIDSLGGVLASSVCIDLNPIRAGMAETPENSDFTSVQDRIAALKGDASNATEENSRTVDKRLSTPKLMEAKDFTSGNLTCSEYIELVDSTGRMQKKDKRGCISDELTDVLTRLNLNTKNWSPSIAELGRMFSRVVGDTNAIAAAVEGTGKKWLKGARAASFVFRA
jgi:hypothetical protein